MRFVARRGVVYKVELHSFRHVDFAVDKGADTNLGSLGVNHDGQRNSQCAANLFDVVDFALVFLVGAVAHVDTRYVHSGKSHFFDLVVVATRRSQRADNFCLSHKFTSVRTV